MFFWRDEFEHLTDQEEDVVMGYLAKKVQAEAILGESKEWATIQALATALRDRGMRLRELLGLTHMNLHGTFPDLPGTNTPSGTPPVILKGVQTKTSRPRVIPLTAPAAAPMATWISVGQLRRIEGDPHRLGMPGGP
jgi:hypothetical protein